MGSREERRKGRMGMRAKERQKKRKIDREKEGRWRGLKHNCPLASEEIVKAFEHPC